MNESTRSSAPLRPLAAIATLAYLAGFGVALVKLGSAVPAEQLIAFALCLGTPMAFAEAHAGAAGLRRAALGVLALLSSLAALVLGGVLAWLAFTPPA